MEALTMVLKKFGNWYIGQWVSTDDANIASYYYVGHRDGTTVPCGDRFFFGRIDAIGLKEGCNHCQASWPDNLHATLKMLLRTM